MDLGEFSDEEVDPISELTYEDFIGHPETLAVLEDRFFENFKRTMEFPVESYYKNEVDYSTENFMEIFHNDFNKRNSYDFFLTIYPFISKNYDISIFDKFPFLAKPLFIKNEDKLETKKKGKTIIDSKKYDWDTKKYK